MHTYLYLVAVAVAALALLAVAVKASPALLRESKRRTHAEVALLGAASLLALVAIYFNFYTETSYFGYGAGDFGSDTWEQYLPYYSNLIANIRDGSFSLWNFEFGLGTSLAATQTWALDPFNVILVPFVLIAGDAHLSLGLVLVHSLKIVLSVFLFDHILTRYCKLPLSRVLGALIYGFAGFVVLYGQHYWLGSIYPVFTLSVLLFEVYLERTTAPRFAGLTACIAALMAWSPYLAFMVLLFDAIYLLLRIAQVKGRLGPAGFAKQVLRMCAPVLCGLLIAAASLIPYVLFLAGETARTGSETSLAERIVSGLTGFIDFDDVLLTLSRMLGSGLINNGSAGWGVIAASGSSAKFDPYEYIMLGFSVGILVLLSQFFHWAFTEADRRTRILVGIATALVILFCVNYFLPLLFTAFVRVQYRCSFILNVPIVLAAAVGFERRLAAGNIAWKPLVVALVLTFGVLVWSFAEVITRKYAIIFFGLALVFASVVFMLVRFRRLALNTALVLLLMCFFSTSVVDVFSYTNLRGLMTASTFPYAQDPACDEGTQAALDYLAQNDSGFYRVEKTYSEWTPTNDALIQHFDGASAYDASIDDDVDTFYEQLWDEAIVQTSSWSKSFGTDPDEPEIAQLIGLKYILSDSELDYDWLSLEATFGNVRVYRCGGVSSIATFRTQVVSETNANALGSSQERRVLLPEVIIVPDEIVESVGVEGSAAGIESLSSGEKVSGEGAEFSFTKETDAHIVGSASASADGFVCLAIPHVAGWSVYVDGQEVETFRADYGFIGFELSAGEHTIEASYTPNGLREGAAISIVGLVVAAGACAFIRRRTLRASA